MDPLVVAAVAKIIEIAIRKFAESSDNSTAKDIDRARAEHDASRREIWAKLNAEGIIAESGFALALTGDGTTVGKLHGGSEG